ncbi:MAG TPA: ABC transporter permease [Thermoanaerobaculia bacterium]|nr:ABC transporter permease [Thermoanaerobaculia bacterium]
MRRFFAGVRDLFRRRGREEDFDRELESFLQISAERKERDGMTPEAALRAARLELGGSRDAVKEGWRDAAWESALGTLGRDLRFAARLLAKNRLVTAIAVGTIALGIGANTAIFSIFDAIVLRELPYPEPGRLVIVWETTSGIPTASVSGPDYRDWLRGQRVFDSMAAGTEAHLTMTGTGEPRRLDGWATSAEIFPLLGARPEAGRLFDADDVRREKRTIVLGHALWRQTFGGNPAILGRTLTLDGEPYEVIGVLPENFHPPTIWTNPQFFVPIRFPATGDRASRGEHWMWTIARRKPGVSLGQAQAAMASLQAALAERYPDTNRNRGAHVILLKKFVGRNIETMLVLLAAAVGFLLAIACANVANLLLAQAARRHREIATRKAIGAGAGRVARQLLTESVLLAALGAAVGLVVGRALQVLLLAVAPPGYIPPSADVRFDFRVFGFAAGLALLTGIVFGGAPGWHAWRLNVAEALKQGGRTTAARGARLRRSLVSLEIGAAFVLLLMTGLALRSLAALLAQDLGFDPRHVLTVGIALPGRFDRRERVLAFFDGAVERVRALPGVESAAIGRRLPLLGGYNGEVQIQGRANPGREAGPSVENNAVGAGFLETLRIPIVRGRPLAPADANRPVAVINEAMAHRFWEDGDPLGARFTWEWGEKDPVWWEVVGVARDVREFGLRQPAIPQAYHPPAPDEIPRVMIMAIRLRPGSAPSLAALSAAIRGGEKDVPLDSVRMIDEILADSASRSRFDSTLLAILGSLSLLLSIAGIYGVMSSLVSQSTHEVGIRMALGASEKRVLAGVLREALAASAAGLAGGVVATLGLTGVLSRLVFGIGAHDPATFTGVAMLLVAVTLVASWLPARRAARIDPVSALRTE